MRRQRGAEVSMTVQGAEAGALVADLALEAVDGTKEEGGAELEELGEVLTGGFGEG